MFCSHLRSMIGLDFVLVLVLGTQVMATSGLAAEAETLREATLLADFVSALDSFATGEKEAAVSDVAAIWMRGFSERQIKREFIDRRLKKAKIGRYKTAGVDPLQPYRTIKVETSGDKRLDLMDRDAAPEAALHAFRIDVEEDYDDMFNDNIYSYYIITHDDLMWGKVSDIYTGLDEGDSFFLSPEDRGLFGPQGQKLRQTSHLIVDFGIVESDGEDIAQLQRLSDAIVDLAVVALSAYDPSAGAAAATARAETKNLLNLIIGMDDDDRLVADTLRLLPGDTTDMLNESTVAEFSRRYAKEDFWTAFAYRIHFRLLR